MMLLCIINIVPILATWASSSEVEPLRLLGILPYTGNVWPCGKVCLTAIEMAIEDINKRKDILEGYRLEFHWCDGMCDAGVATHIMYELLNKTPTKLVIVGAGCSVSTTPTAQASYLWNVTQISWGSSSPILSDRSRFPKFFRLAAPDTNLNPARLELFRYFGWKRVATIHETLELFSSVTDDFIKRAKDYNISIITSEIFSENPATQLENLKRHDARIIIAGCYSPKAILLLCEAHKIGLYGPKIIWVFPGWYFENWWIGGVQGTSCTQEQINEVISSNGVLQTGYFFRNPKQEKGIAQITADEFETLFYNRLNDSAQYELCNYAGGPSYDVVWAVALALNKTNALMIEQGFETTIDQFGYTDTDISEAVTNSFYSVDFIGVKGQVKFQQNGDPVTSIKIEQIRDAKEVFVGIYHPDSQDNAIEWVEDGIVWPEGKIPKDSSIIIEDTRHSNVNIYVGMTAFASLGIFTAIIFFVFNVRYRNNRNVKMSSPNINNILLLGCIITYSTVFIQPFREQSVLMFCKVRTYFFTIGFSLAFGALFSKTWRVYRIFSNKNLQKMKIRDTQLLGSVAVLLCVDICILLIWNIVDPQYIEYHHLQKEVSLEDDDVVIQPIILLCVSRHSSYFMWTLYIIQGSLLAFGTFLAWETRKVTIEVLNDSRYIGICLYNVVVMSSLGVAMSLVLQHQVTLLYGFTSGFIILGTTLTQLIVFIPKIKEAKQSTTRILASSAHPSSAEGFRTGFTEEIN